MVPFAGWEMPVQYPSGILKEHAAAREAAALFDVSHMGQAVLRAHSGDPREAALALERLVADLGRRAEGGAAALRACFTSDDGRAAGRLHGRQSRATAFSWW